MSDPVYIPLRLHSEYSITDGTVRLKALIKKALAEGLPALGISDLMNGFGLVKFYKACRGAGIKPVIGADVRIENPDRPDTPFRALLLVKNHNGYLRLSELLTRAFTCQEEGCLPQLKQAWLGEGGRASRGRPGSGSQTPASGRRATRPGSRPGGATGPTTSTAPWPP